MARKISTYKQILKLLEELHTDYPNFGLGRHLSTALSDYGDFWGITDKDFLFVLQKYEAELAIDNNEVVSEEYVERIKRDAEDLTTLLNDDYE